MNNADLAEIRALLQANAAPDRRSRAPLFGALRSLLPSPAADARPVMPAPRRVGLRPAEPADVEAVEALLLDEPVAHDPIAAAGLEAASEARKRRAFGQRQETAHDPVPILRLAAPMALLAGPEDDADVAEVLRRRSLRLAPVALAAAETPFLPEDLSDTMEGDAEQIYADSGLFEPNPSTAPDAIDPERTLLLRLEQSFLAERARLDRARRG